MGDWVTVDFAGVCGGLGHCGLCWRVWDWVTVDFAGVCGTGRGYSTITTKHGINMTLYQVCHAKH